MKIVYFVRDLLAAERAGIHSGLFFPPAHARYVPQEEVVKDARPTAVIQSWQELSDQLPSKEYIHA